MYRSCSGQDTIECSTSSMQLSSVVKSPKGVRDGAAGTTSLYNGSDVDRSQHRGSSDLRVQNIVYVLNMRGQPLMPTTQQKANKILKQGKAQVVRRKPFTIQLKYATGETEQYIVLGIDTGFEDVGLSAITPKTELLSVKATLRTDISKKLIQRGQYRRTRRGRKWHREPRFDNRKRRDAWLPPSVQHKVDSHIRLIDFVKTILPISKAVVERSKFDIARINHSEWEGTDFQHGDQYGYENVKMYVRDRDGYKCRNCGNRKRKLEVHHILPRIDGGSDGSANLVTLCHKCHDGHHKGKIVLRLKKPPVRKQMTIMNILGSRLSNLYSTTYGYITKFRRMELGLEKSHLNDAFVIAGGVKQPRSMPIMLEQVRRNNRSIQTNRKGFKPSIRRRRYKLQPKDVVRFNSMLHTVKGVFSYGKWVRLVDSIGNIVNTSIKNVRLIKYGKGFGI